jgi:hypothetical protein
VEEYGTKLRAIFFITAFSPLLGAGGCAFGPKALEMTHGRYSEAVREVRDEQLLRDLVHLRYNEATTELNIASIAAQYELGATAEARPFFVAPNPSNSNVIFRTFTAILPDVSMTGTDRPTLTLDPADDSDAIRRFLTPITSETLIFLTESGWPVSTIARLYVERANGVPNAMGASGPQRDVPLDFARFMRVIELMQICQDRELASVHSEERIHLVGDPLPAAAVVEAMKNGLEVRQTPDGKSWKLARRERHIVLEVAPEASASLELAELLAILNLAPGLPRYELTFVQRGPEDPLHHPTSPTAELQIVPRSTAQVYFYLANGIEVPAEHISCGLVHPALDDHGNPFDGREITRGLFEVRVYKGHKPPKNAYVAVPYRGYWYYIDDADSTTKATFALMLKLSRLDFAHLREGIGAKPLLTLPVGR